MGDMAEDAYTGLCCSGCGIYFVNEHGYPVLCKDCWTESAEIQKAHIDEV
jgi:hypothetical protein